jgi:hypothetical protein
MNKADKNQQPVYKVPVKGSLGLLAYGDRGLRAWREVRDKDQKKSPKK